MSWPRDLRLAYKVLGNCVSPIPARIVNGWIMTFWLKMPFSFQSLWDEFRLFDESISKLGDFLFFQNDEWIWWDAPSRSRNLQPINADYIQVSVFADNRRFDCKVPFVHGLTFRQILAALYPCNWNYVPIAIQGGHCLQDVCVGGFYVVIQDIRLHIEGIGWVQVSPFQPVRHIADKVKRLKGLDISSLQIGVNGREVDPSMMIAALLPCNFFYTLDDFGQRFVNFLTPSVKRNKNPSGQFLPQPVVLLCGLIHPCTVRIQIVHSTGSECICLTIEEECGLSYLQVLKLALQDFSRPINFEMICPAGQSGDVCRGSFQVQLVDIEFVIEPYGTEKFSHFDRLSDVINRVCLKHFGHLTDLILLCNEHRCDLDQRLGTTIDTHCFRIKTPDPGPTVSINSGLTSDVSFPQCLYKVKVHQTSGSVNFDGTFDSQSSFQEVVDSILPHGKKIKWKLIQTCSDGIADILHSSKATTEFEIFAFDIPVVVEPLGIFFLPPFASLSDLLRKVSLEKYGGVANLAVRVNNVVLDMTTFVISANQQGVIRTQLFQGFGGSPVRNKLQTLLVQHGVPQDASGERANHLIEACGQKIIEQALAMTNPWTRYQTTGHCKEIPTHHSS